MQLYQFDSIRTVTEFVGAEELSTVALRTRGSFLEWLLSVPVPTSTQTYSSAYRVQAS